MIADYLSSPWIPPVSVLKVSTSNKARGGGGGGRSKGRMLPQTQTHMLDTEIHTCCLPIY